MFPIIMWGLLPVDFKLQILWNMKYLLIVLEILFLSPTFPFSFSFHDLNPDVIRL